MVIAWVGIAAAPLSAKSMPMVTMNGFTCSPSTISAFNRPIATPSPTEIRMVSSGLSSSPIPSGAAAISHAATIVVKASVPSTDRSMLPEIIVSAPPIDSRSSTEAASNRFVRLASVA